MPKSTLIADGFPWIAESLSMLRVIVWQADTRMRFEHVTTNSTEILGFDYQQWLNEADFFWSHLHPADREFVKTKLSQESTSGRDFSIDFRMLSKSGGVVWFSAVFRPLPDQFGRIPGFRGIFHDTTKSKLAEDALRVNQQGYRYVIDHAHDIIYSTDLSGNLTFFNNAAPSTLRVAADQLAGQRYLDLVRPDYRPVVQRFYLRQFISRQSSSYFEFPVLTGDGEYVWIGQNVQLIFDQDHPVGFQGIARDLTERKRAEERLRESEERHRIVAETATDAILTIDDDNEILYVNHAAEKTFGYSREEMVGQPLGFLVPNYPRRFHQHSAMLDLSSGQGYFGTEPFELVGRHRDGSPIPLEISIGELTEAGRHMFTAVVRDITERKRTEEALRRVHQRFRSLIENSSDIVTIIDREGRIHYESPSLTRILGYEPQDLAGRSIFDIVHPEDLESMNDLLERRLQAWDASVLVPVELRIRHQDGSWRTLEAVGRNLSNDPSIRGVVMNLRDISDRKLAEEELRAANETLRTLIEASPLAIITLDSKGLVTMWNTAAERMFGWTAAEIIGKELPIVPPQLADQGAEFIETLKRGRSLALDTIRRRKDGAILNVSFSAAPLLQPDGSMRGVVALITDITDRKRLEEQLRQSQKMEAVGRLAGGVAHDFNNLLTVIAGYDQLLLNSLPIGDRSRSYSEEIMNAAERASSLTRQLLAFSRRQVAQPRIIGLNSVVENMSSMLRRLIGENIELSTLLKPGLATVFADPGQVEQIILNLVLNARDAMTDGGLLTIETDNVRLGPDYVRAHVSTQSGAHVLLSVSDTGLGMNAETRSRIFEPFFTTKEFGKGTGLGLATVYGIVKQNNANVWVYSEEGVGTTFKVYFPAEEADPEEEASAPSRGVHAGSETILVVEDEPGLRDLVRKLLALCGYRVLVAGNSREATALCKDFPDQIHLLLSDVIMPEVNGRELAAVLTKVRPDMRVLYMSGYPDETIVHHGVLERGVAFLQKPFSLEALAAKVREVLDAPGKSTRQVQ